MKYVDSIVLLRAIDATINNNEGQKGKTSPLAGLLNSPYWLVFTLLTVSGVIRTHGLPQKLGITDLYPVNLSTNLPVDNWTS